MNIIDRYLSNGAGPLRECKKELSEGYDQLQTAMDLVGFEASVSVNLTRDRHAYMDMIYGHMIMN
jgi:hypothetical protein